MRHARRTPSRASPQASAPATDTVKPGTAGMPILGLCVRRPMTVLSAVPAPTTSDRLLAAARALGASGGGAGAAKIMALLYDPDAEIDEVMDCLRGDPGLAARVLKVANAPYYRQAGNIGTVERAVAVLGLKAIRGVAASGCLDRMTPPRSGKGFDPDRFRQHSQAVALAAQQLSADLGWGLEGEAFMAGLLHDIGLLVLVKLDSAAMASFEPPANAEPAALLAAEQAHFGHHHESCGALLVQMWQLPAWLHQAVGGHHAAAPAEATGLERLPLLLDLADDVARAAGYAWQPADADSARERLGVRATALGLDTAVLLAAADGLPQAMADFSAS